jgi:hypothetical protein
MCMQGSWRRDAACAPQNRTKEAEDLDWFSTDAKEKYAARAVCQNQCPVRKECLQEALLHSERWGIHGGVDDYELRRTLCIDADGDPVERDRPPRCPYCLNRKINVSGQKSRQGYRTNCPDCGMVWYMALIPAKLKGKRAA